MSEGPTPRPQPTPAQSYRYQGTCCCTRCRQHSLFGPVILITIGAIFLVGQFVPGWGFGELWPLILIVIGVIKLLESTASTEGHRG